MLQTCQILGVAICLLVSRATYGQTVITVPDDAKFVVQVDVEAFRDTLVGGKLLKLTQRMAAAELGTDSQEIMQKVEEAVGFNPLEEVQNLTVIGSSFEEAEENLQVILRLRQTTGNLEGMMLALPNYSSEDHGKYTIHSAQDGDMTAYCAVHSGRDGNKTILASTQRSDVTSLLDALDSDAKTFKKRKTVSWVVPEGTFVQVQVLQFPDEVMELEQAANISRLLEDVAITVGEEGENLSANLILTTLDEKRAEQIQQLVQGMQALVGLFKEEIGDDEEAQMAVSVAEKITVERDGTTVVVQASVPQAMILEFLRKEADLPL